jgi:hypothetical protein
MAAALVTTRRLLPPRSVEEQPACFVVRDHDGQQLAYVYLLSNDQAYCIGNIDLSRRWNLF